jgi:hypothetical protein
LPHKGTGSRTLNIYWLYNIKSIQQDEYRRQISSCLEYENSVLVSDATNPRKTSYVLHCKEANVRQRRSSSSATGVIPNWPCQVHASTRLGRLTLTGSDSVYVNSYSKAIRVTVGGDLQGCEMLGIQHCLDYRLRDGGEVVR